MKIINDHGQDCQVDEEGELMAKGKNIMKGYYLDDKETDASFKDGWLCTGDLARMDKEGFFYIVGRKKEFIKVRGIRVSPKEIEEVILRIKEVVDCKIVGYNDDLTGEGILAKITISETADIESVRSNIIQSCRNDLSEHKVPTKFEFREKLDMKTSGKT
jgi:acyl-CoA synthetase (AMP-forming)/AMP-acid ligase II